MPFDNTLFLFLNKFANQSRFFDYAIIFFAEYLAYILVIVTAGYFWWRIRREEKLRAALAMFIAVGVSRGIITELIRKLYPRVRPFIAYHIQPLFIDNAASFPSGHATFFFALSAVIFYYNKKLGWWFIFASTLMGIARVAAGVHYPFDIIAGAVIGILSGWAVMAYLGTKKDGLSRL